MYAARSEETAIERFGSPWNSIPLARAFISSPRGKF
jgi:hypothetical protein